MNEHFAVDTNKDPQNRLGSAIAASAVVSFVCAPILSFPFNTRSESRIGFRQNTQEVKKSELSADHSRKVVVIESIFSEEAKQLANSSEGTQSLIDDALRELAAHFPDKTSVKVEVFTDPYDGDDALLMSVKSTLAPSDASDRLDEFGLRWWYDNERRSHVPVILRVAA